MLFADVVNYTSMAEKLDPEEVHQIVDGCFEILMDEVHRYEGTIVARLEPGDLKSAHAQDSHANKRHQVPVGILSLAPDPDSYLRDAPVPFYSLKHRVG